MNCYFSNKPYLSIQGGGFQVLWNTTHPCFDYLDRRSLDPGAPGRDRDS